MPCMRKGVVIDESEDMQENDWGRGKNALDVLSVYMDGLRNERGVRQCKRSMRRG